MSQQSKQRQTERDLKLGRQKPISAAFKRARKAEAEAKARKLYEEEFNKIAPANTANPLVPA